jgi:penicillin-binding protein 1A
MVKYGYLPESEAQDLQNQAILLKFKVENHNTGLAPYFREAIKKQLLAIIEDLNQSRGDDEQLNLYTSGLKIHATLDSRMQQYAEESMREHMMAQQKKFYEHWKGVILGLTSTCVKSKAS